MTGHITGEYYEALKKNGFRAYAGTDASKQPPDMPDVFPHETAVAWTRNYLKKHPISKGNLDTMQAELRQKLAECARFINKHYEVADLHKSFPKRLKELVRRKGGRVTH